MARIHQGKEKQTPKNTDKNLVVTDNYKRQYPPIDYTIEVPEFIKAKVECPNLPISEFCKTRYLPYNTFKAYLSWHPEIMDEVLTKIRRNYQHSSIGIDKALEKKALEGDPRAIDLWYRRMEAWNPHKGDLGAGTIINVIVSPDILPEALREKKISFRVGKQSTDDDQQDHEDTPLLTE